MCRRLKDLKIQNIFQLGWVESCHLNSWYQQFYRLNCQFNPHQSTFPKPYRHLCQCKIQQCPFHSCGSYDVGFVNSFSPNDFPFPVAAIFHSPLAGKARPAMYFGLIFLFVNASLDLPGNVWGLLETKWEQDTPKSWWNWCVIFGEMGTLIPERTMRPNLANPGVSLMIFPQEALRSIQYILQCRYYHIYPFKIFTTKSLSSQEVIWETSGNLPNSHEPMWLGLFCTWKQRLKVFESFKALPVAAGLRWTRRNPLSRDSFDSKRRCDLWMCRIFFRFAYIWAAVHLHIWYMIYLSLCMIDIGVFLWWYMYSQMRNIYKCSVLLVMPTFCWSLDWLVGSTICHLQMLIVTQHLPSPLLPRRAEIHPKDPIKQSSR